MKHLFKQSNNRLQILFNCGILVFILGLSAYLFLLKADKIAYVDSARLLNGYKGAEQARKAYQDKAKLWQANIDTLTSEIKSSIKKHEHALSGMSAKEQASSKEAINAKQKQLLNYQKAVQENAKDEDGKLSQVIVAQINSSLSRFGKENRYKIIFIANQSGTIAYAKEGMDITDQVLENLNSTYTASK